MRNKITFLSEIHSFNQYWPKTFPARVFSRSRFYATNDFQAVVSDGKTFFWTFFFLAKIAWYRKIGHRARSGENGHLSIDWVNSESKKTNHAFYVHAHIHALRQKECTARIATYLYGIIFKAGSQPLAVLFPMKKQQRNCRCNSGRPKSRFRRKKNMKTENMERWHLMTWELRRLFSAAFPISPKPQKTV